MTRDPRLTTKFQRDGFRNYPRKDAVLQELLSMLLNDIDVRIEREKKLREALDDLRAILDKRPGELSSTEMRKLQAAARILAETADDE